MEDSSTTPIDDRWSAFQDPNRVLSLGTRKVEDQGPDLSEYIEKVLEQRSSQKRQERKYNIATCLVRLVTSMAHALTTEWKLLLQVNKKNKVRTTKLRTLAGNMYECMVPLMRPTKPNAFQVTRGSPELMPPYRYLVQLDPGLSREEALLIRREWYPHIDKSGCLRPHGFLDWFNAGLFKASSVLMAESSRVRNVRCKTLQDGTVTLHISITTETDKVPVGESCEVETLAVNIFPVFVLDSIPLNVTIENPLPHTGAFVQSSKLLRQLIFQDLEEGELVVLLEPRAHHVGLVKNRVTPEGPSWLLNLSFTEDHIYHLLDKHCTTEYRRSVELLGVIRQQYPDDLKIIHDDILVNTLFNVSHKHFPALLKLHDWFLEMLKYLIAGLKSERLPSFYFKRQNLLKTSHVTTSERQKALEKLKQVFEAVRQNPKSIYDFTGYEHKRKNKEESGDSDSGSESEEEKRDDNKQET